MKALELIKQNMKNLAADLKFNATKNGGMGYTLEVMPYIDHLTDITLVYKSPKKVSGLFMRELNEASVTINTYKIPKN